MGIASAAQVETPAIRLREIEAELAALRREQRLFRRLGFGENVKVMQIVVLQLERQECLDALRPHRRTRRWDMRELGENAYLDPLLRGWPSDVARTSFANAITALWVGGSVLGSFVERCAGAWRDGGDGKVRLAGGGAILRHATSYALLAFGLLLFIARTVLALDESPRAKSHRVPRRVDAASRRTGKAISATGSAVGEASRAVAATGRVLGARGRTLSAGSRTWSAGGSAVTAASNATRATRSAMNATTIFLRRAAGLLRLLGGLTLAGTIAFVRWAYPRVLALRATARSPRRPARSVRSVPATTRARSASRGRAPQLSGDAARRAGVLALEVRRVPVSKAG